MRLVEEIVLVCIVLYCVFYVLFVLIKNKKGDFSPLVVYLEQYLALAKSISSDLNSVLLIA